MTESSNDDFSTAQKQGQFVRLIAKKSAYVFRMRWRGDKYPDGATIGGIPIVRAQGGEITGPEGEALGFYDRPIEFGGKRHDTQVIVISTQSPDVTPPPGGSVKPLKRAPRPGPMF